MVLASGGFLFDQLGQRRRTFRTPLVRRAGGALLFLLLLLFVAVTEAAARLLLFLGMAAIIPDVRQVFASVHPRQGLRLLDKVVFVATRD